MRNMKNPGVSNMKNPFEYGGVVSGDAFCNREKELTDLFSAMENSEKLFVYSERRMGKTSLVRRAIEKLNNNEYLSAYVDLWPTDDEVSFATATAKAIAESMSTNVERLLELARTFFGRLVPSITVNDEGKPQVAFGISRANDPGPGIDEVLEAPAKIASQRQKKVVMVFDEFQQLLEYKSDIVERRLRSSIQNHKEVAYIFLGSRKHLIQKMFIDRSRPLYRAGGHYPLGPIAEPDWIPFIQRRFIDADKQISDEQIRSVCRLTEGHPFYTQHLCHALWELSQEGDTVTEELIDSALKLLLDRESYAYTTLWESLAMNQRRFLKGLAGEPAGVQPFASDFIQRYGLRTASNVQRVVEPLLERDIIDRNNGAFLIIDRFFRIWIQKIQL
jgi:AAA+ ATPase superfamily predicted ATPase